MQEPATPVDSKRYEFSANQQNSRAFVVQVWNEGFPFSCSSSSLGPAKCCGVWLSHWDDRATRVWIFYFCGLYCIEHFFNEFLILLCSCWRLDTLRMTTFPMNIRRTIETINAWSILTRTIEFLSSLFIAILSRSWVVIVFSSHQLAILLRRSGNASKSIWLWKILQMSLPLGFAAKVSLLSVINTFLMDRNLGACLLEWWHYL
jgi:hypothetical protein